MKKHKLNRKPLYYQSGSQVYNNDQNWLTNSLRERLYNNFTPMNYDHPVSRFLSAVVANKEAYNRYKAPPIRNDAWALYLGLPQENQYFQPAQYHPSQASEPNAQYYDSLKPDFRGTIMNEIGDMVNHNSFNKAAYRSLGNVLGDYKVSKGEDEKGKYYSYYDKWDLNGAGPIGNPYEIYGRIYADELNNRHKELKNFDPAKTKWEGQGGYYTNPDNTILYDEGRNRYIDRVSGFTLGRKNKNGEFEKFDIPDKEYKMGGATKHKMKRMPLYYKKGGFFNRIGQGLRSFGDMSLTFLGAPDVIKNTPYDQALQQNPGLATFTNTAGAVGRTALNIVAPGAGTLVNVAGQTLNNATQQPQQYNFDPSQFGYNSPAAYASMGQYYPGTPGYAGPMNEQFNPASLFSGLSSLFGLIQQVGQMQQGGQVAQQMPQIPKKPFDYKDGALYLDGQQIDPLEQAAYYRTLVKDAIDQGTYNDNLDYGTLSQIATILEDYPNMSERDRKNFTKSRVNSKMKFLNKQATKSDRLGEFLDFIQAIPMQQQYRKGGITKYQQGGPVQNEMVDLQAEKGELIFHPTGFLTDVHARRTHAQMKKSGDSEMVTDHPLSNSFIFSDYVKISRDDAQELQVGVRRYPYHESSKGKEPEVFSVGDLFKKHEKKATAGDLARRVKNIWKVTENKDDIFDILGDQLNMENRKPYLQGIAMLSEIQRMEEEQQQPQQMLPFAKKGGKIVRRPWVPRFQAGSSVWTNGTMGDLNSSLNDLQGLINQRNVWSPLDQLPTLPMPNYINPISIGPNMIDRINDGVNNTPSYFNPVPQQRPDSLQTFAKAAIPIGAGIQTGANLAGAVGSYALYNNLIRENQDFYNQQRGYLNQSRNLATAGNMLTTGLNLLQNAPVDLPTNDATRLRSFNPYRAVNTARQLGQQGIGQINSMIRMNPDYRGLNVGQAIAQNNQSIAQATNQALQNEYQIGNQLDQIDFQNKNIIAGNQQRRNDFGNQLIQGTAQGVGNIFSNEASRQLDLLGLNAGQRQSDVLYRQQRLYQPISYASAAGQSLSNMGASILPQVYGQVGQNGNRTLDTMSGLLNILDTIGIFKKNG